MFAYDKTFDREVFLGHCDLISWFSDFFFSPEQNLKPIQSQKFVPQNVLNRGGFNVYPQSVF